MGFSDEIEVAMIAVNKATILEITGDDRIAIPMTFDNIGRANLPKRVLHVQSFCFVLPF